MVQEQRKELLVKRNGGHRAAGEPSAKLASMPLAVLLLRLGDLREIASFREEFAERAAELQAWNFAGNGAAEEDAELRRRRSMEESMLNQVVQWLSLQADRE